MSWQETAKKELEGMELDSFLEAYEHATGAGLRVVASAENPDFVCARPDGSLIGIELTKVMRDKNIARGERIVTGKESMDDYEMLESIHWQLKRKEEARKSRYVKSVEENILVLLLVDGALSRGFVWMIDGLVDDFTDHGFSEVWLADYSGLDAYGDIELFSLHPPSRWGHYERRDPDRKPFG